MDDLTKELVESFKKAGQKVTKTLDGKDLVMRCPYCGHTSSPGKRHMYVSVVPPFMFHCWKCETTGVLNNKTLREFKVMDPNIQLTIIEANKKNPKQKGITKKKFNYNILNFGMEQTSVVLNNLKYFNNRFGTQYGIKDIPMMIDKYKIIFDPEAFFKKNNIKKPDNFMFNKSIGFVSRDKKFGIFRDTSGLQKIRYSNVRFNPDDLEASKLYTIGTEVNILSEKINIVMTEGIFDIIGVKEHFYNKENLDYIFIASCGKSFDLAVSTIVKMGFLDFDLTIYSDADVDITMYRDIKNDSEFLKNKKITIYYNNIGKDYGVPKEQINLRKVVI